jgi:cation transport protein ChaC
MMALDRGGRCNGVVYRLPDDDRPAQIRGLAKRELDYREDLEGVRWVTVRTNQGNLRALCFWAGPPIKLLKKLPMADVAAILARACGYWGSCAEYLYNTVVHLEELGIRDRNLWRLQKLVAAEIKAIHGLNV